MSSSRYKKNYVATKHIFTGWFNQQYERMSKRNRVKFSKELPFDRWEFEAWAIEQQYKEFTQQFASWVKSEYATDERPSTDRIDDTKGYSLQNLRIVSWKENKEKEWASEKHKNVEHMVSQTRRPVLATLSSGEEVHFQSLSEAARVLSVDTGSICECCKGKEKAERV